MTQNTQTKPLDETSVNGETPVYNDAPDSLSSVIDETESLREELAIERDKHLRLAAEYSNYRRRTKLERERAIDQGKRELLERLISLADDLDLALATEDESSGAVAEGWRLIHRRFYQMLEANNVVPFESKGERFDPERHEAFDVVRDTNLEPGTVQTQIRCGYFWHGKLLRPALVVVAE